MVLVLHNYINCFNDSLIEHNKVNQHYAHSNIIQITYNLSLGLKL